MSKPKLKFDPTFWDKLKVVPSLEDQVDIVRSVSVADYSIMNEDGFTHWCKRREVQAEIKRQNQEEAAREHPKPYTDRSHAETVSKGVWLMHKHGIKPPEVEFPKPEPRPETLVETPVETLVRLNATRQLSWAEIKGIAMHQMLHELYRKRSSWNEAVDYVISDMLAEHGIYPPKEG